MNIVGGKEVEELFSAYYCSSPVYIQVLERRLLLKVKAVQDQRDR